MAKRKVKKAAADGTSSSKAKKSRSGEEIAIKVSETYENVEEWTKTFGEGLKNGTPFPHWQLENFIDNAASTVEDIEEELQNFPNWHRKENDLYSLYQTDDFKSLNAEEHPSLCLLRQFLYGPVKDWLSKVSGIELLDQVDMNGSCYAHTDGLLPHNDLIDTRRFAFVYYVTPFVWDKSNGGELNLYNSDDDDQPTTVAVKLTPRRNSLLLFEVSHRSWHRVAEILGTEDPRLSVNGWFHSSRKLEAKSANMIQQPRLDQTALNEKLNSIINKTYLDSKKKSQIQELFGDSSEVSLKKILTDKFAASVLADLKIGHFDEIGPPSKRRIKHGDVEKFGGNCTRLLTILKSSTMSEYVSSLTGCDLNDCPVSAAVSQIESGSYTVMGDEDADKAEKEGYSLEAHFFFGENEWAEKSGGETIYVGKGDEEPLITIHPEPNSLALVLRDPEVLSFLKYTTSVAEGCFYQITLTYHGIHIDPSSEGEEAGNEEEEGSVGEEA